MARKTAARYSRPLGTVTAGRATVATGYAVRHANKPFAYTVTDDAATVARITDSQTGTMGSTHALVVRLAAAIGVPADRVRHVTPVTVVESCGKCQGSGHLGMYAHVAGGECFDCEGEGVRDEYTVYEVVEYAADADAAARSRADIDSPPARLDDFLANFFANVGSAPLLLTATVR